MLWPVGTGQGTLAGRAYGLVLRRLKTARKQSKRGGKLALSVWRRVKQAQKSAYFRLRDSDTGRVLLKAAGLVRSPRDLRHRAQVAGPYIARLRTPGAPIDRAQGYGLLSLDALGDASQALESCRRLFEIKKAAIDAEAAGFDTWSPEQRQKFLSRKQSFLRYLLDDRDLREHPALVEFALSEPMLGAATRYLGMVPYLTRVDLMYSLPRAAGGNIESQLFHLDHEGVTQIKHFIHVFDVGGREGPFTFIPADATSRIVREVRALRRKRQSGKDIELRRYSDEEIAAVGGTDDIVTVTGPVGSGVAVDTSRCLHLGSRVDPGSFRLCLYLQYCTTHEITNVYDVERFRNDPVRVPGREGQRGRRPPPRRRLLQRDDGLVGGQNVSTPKLQLPTPKPRILGSWMLGGLS